jgi:alanyl-tRNA synthetase
MMMSLQKPTLPTKKPFTGAEIREAFLGYFEQTLGHKRLPSASLVPINNPTVLLTPAGMLPFVPIFMGLEPAPNPPRATTSQKCARVSGKASDLEAVGRTPRHHTFFEMLGNFSFGDYFKHDVIPWAWTFMTEVLGIDANRLWVSVFREDDEAYAIWRDVVGVPESRIFRCDEKDNFWGPPGPTGPCGPCTEIHYDLTQNPDHDLDTRLIELWNLVFMEFFKDAEGNCTPLEKKNVDTGAGLERLAMVVQGVENTFETDLFQNIVKAVSAKCGIAYRTSEATDVALKIVADHLRMLAFAIADGVVPSNEGRGYIIRMILRRAVRYGKQFLGFESAFLYDLLSIIKTEYEAVYPEVGQRYAYTYDVLLREETRFLETLDKGSKQLDEILHQLKAEGKTELDGAVAFRLYDTYGFPVELSKDIAQEQGFTLDEAGFETAMQAQKTLARAGKKDVAIVNDQVFSEILETAGKTAFLGYETLESTAVVQALIVDGESVSKVSGVNQPFLLVLNQTPFYAESGGQLGDLGQIHQETGQLALTVLVKDTQKMGDLIVHHCVLDQQGEAGLGLAVGDAVTALVDATHRQNTAIHHSATHLLHTALKQVLGDEAAQAGSAVGAEGARFDFSFSRGVTKEELHQIEAKVNQWVLAGIAQHTQEMPIAEAKKAGAVAMFGEKYGDTVRVVQFGQASMELCGGTHVQNLAQIGLVRIVGEQAVAAGVRRIEFVAGWQAYKGFRQAENLLKQVMGQLKVPQGDLLDRIEKLQSDLKQSEKDLQTFKQKSAIAAQLPILKTVLEAQSGQAIPLVKLFIADTEADTLKTLGEAFINQANQPIALILGSNVEGKAVILVWVDETLVKQGVKAGEIVKTLAAACEGGGGGKPTFAQAGGKAGHLLAEALASFQLG